MPALPSTSATVVSDWAYVAEGGATLVLRYVGGPHPVFSRSVLRLRKRPRGTPDEPGGVEGGVDASVYGGEDTNEDDVGPLLVSFQADVVAPLLPPDTVGTMRLVPVNPHWLAAVAAAVEPARPAARRDVDEVDIALRTAVLAPDLIGAAGVVVEIKPKWGFLPSPVPLSLETRLVKTQTCRFCLHAYYRVFVGDRVREAHYCPLDLYSGQEERIENALRALWDDWAESRGDRNNLRVFVDGEIVRPSEPDSLRALARHLLPDHTAPTEVDLRDALAARLMPLLYVSPVLPALSRLQRTLDALDIEGVSALVQPAFHAASTAGSEYSDDEDEEEPENPLRPVSLEEWVAFRRRWQKDTRDGSVSPLDTVPDEDDVRHHVLAALLAGTFKDCSLLVRVPLAATATATTTSSSDPPPIALVDLDPKRPGKLPRWAALDERLAAAYSLLPPEERKTCVDGRAAPFPPVPEREGSVGRGIRRRRRNGGKDGGDDEEAWGALEVGTLPYLLGITALVAAGAIVPRLL